MFEERIDQIKKLSEIEMMYFEISSCLFARENKEILNNEVQNFERNFDELVQKNNFNKENLGNDKKLLVKKYESIISSFLDSVDTLFSNIMEKIVNIETNQNIALIKRETLNDVQEMISNTNGEDDFKSLMKTIDDLNLSINNIEDKSIDITQKVTNYELIIDYCKEELDVCYYTREHEIEELRNNKFEFQAQHKINIFNKKDTDKKNLNDFIERYNGYLDNLEKDVVSKLNENIFYYIDNFDIKTENMQEQVSSGGVFNV